jgi:two-component system sensor histidine kinase CpxA
VAAVPPVQLTDFIPYYVLILATVALLSWLLTRGIVSPIRDIAGIVTEFGGGKLAARAVVNRSDEIGKLASAFNQMADRIETLVTAERRLLQDVSHELRSPLTRLNLAIELSRGAVDQNASADRLQREAERLTRLVDTLLEVTRLEGEAPVTSDDIVNVAAVVDEIVADCGLEAEQRGCYLVFDRPSHAGARARGNRELLRRAVENVVRNAIRYAPKGTPVVVSCVPERGGEVIVSVRDFGPGVPDDALAHLGSPFFRADPSRDSATGGVGLGLAIARRAIQLHHGRWSAVNAKPGLSVEMTVPAAADGP